MNKYYENVMLGLFIISFFFTVIFGYIGIFNIFDSSSIFTQLLGFIFWVSDGYIHLRAYKAISDDYKNKSSHN